MRYIKGLATAITSLVITLAVAYVMGINEVLTVQSSIVLLIADIAAINMVKGR